MKSKITYILFLCSIALFSTYILIISNSLLLKQILLILISVNCLIWVLYIFWNYARNRLYEIIEFSNVGIIFDIYFMILLLWSGHMKVFLLYLIATCSEISIIRGEDIDPKIIWMKQQRLNETKK